MRKNTNQAIKSNTGQINDIINDLIAVIKKEMLLLSKNGYSKLQIKFYSAATLRRLEILTTPEMIVINNKIPVGHEIEILLYIVEKFKKDGFKVISDIENYYVKEFSILW